MKATVQYFPLVLFIMLYKVVLTSGSVGEILNCVKIHVKRAEQYFTVAFHALNLIVTKIYKKLKLVIVSRAYLYNILFNNLYFLVTV